MCLAGGEPIYDIPPFLGAVEAQEVDSIRAMKVEMRDTLLLVQRIEQRTVSQQQPLPVSRFQCGTQIGTVGNEAQGGTQCVRLQIQDPREVRGDRGNAGGDHFVEMAFLVPQHHRTEAGDEHDQGVPPAVASIVGARACRRTAPPGGGPPPAPLWSFHAANALHSFTP